jgi:hypothetical protein
LGDQHFFYCLFTCNKTFLYQILLKVDNTDHFIPTNCVEEVILGLKA